MANLVVIGGCLLTLSLSTLALSLDATTTTTRCTESCLRINPYDSVANLTHAEVKHCTKFTADGKCECDWEKVLTAEGECRCRNPRHSVNENNECVCDPGRCPPVMTGCTIKDELLDECCPQFECDSCPDDSYTSNRTQDDKCLCYPCKLASSCKSNQTTKIIRKGTQKPGTCCDLYECHDILVKKNCTSKVDGKKYIDQETWIKDGCTLYRCDNGIIFHESLKDCNKNCISKGQVYENHQSWTEDECTNCTCENGEKKCMAHFCKDLPSATIRPKEEECPMMEGCMKECPFGFKLNRRGCELCKCRQPDAKTVQDILRALNCSAESCDVLHTLPSVCKEETNMSVEQCPKCADTPPPSGTTWWPAILLTSTATLSIVCAILVWLVWRERRRALCSIHRPQAPAAHDKYHHIPMFDANLNQDNKAMLVAASAMNEKEYR